jgi:DNA-binding transcriptional ArsR family regulator
MARQRAFQDPFRAIADRTRRAILDLLLLRSDQCVAELAAHFRMSQPAVSQHLRVLRRAGLVTFVRVDREHRYRLAALPLAAVAAWLHPYDRGIARELRAMPAPVRATPRRRRR